MPLLGNQNVLGNFPNDKFSGNGSQTAFTLSQTPASVTSIDVYVSGVKQDTANYSVSGKTLTFTTAPPSPASGVVNNIEVCYKGVLGSINSPAAGAINNANQFNGNALPSGIGYPVGSIPFAALVGSDWSSPNLAYIKLPSGLYVQWGLVNLTMVAIGSWAAGAITFPTAFPTAFSVAVVTQNGESNAGMPITMNQTKTGMTVGFYNSAGSTSAVNTYHWIALGY